MKGVKEESDGRREDKREWKKEEEEKGEEWERWRRGE